MRTSRHPASTQTTFPTWRPCSSLSLEWSTYVEISSPNNPWTYLNTLFSLRRLSAVPSLILRYLVCQSCRLWKRCQRWEALAAERPAKLCPIHAQCQRKSCTFEAMTWHSWAAHAHCQMWICLKIRYLRFLWSTLSLSLYLNIYIYIWLTIGVGLFIWAFLFSGVWTQELFADFQELFAEFQELFEKTCIILRGVSEGNPPAPKVLGRDLPDGTRKRLQVYLGGGIFRPKPPVFDRSWRSPSKNTVKNSTEDTCSWTRPSKIGKRKVKKPCVFHLFDLNFLVCNIFFCGSAGGRVLDPFSDWFSSFCDSRNTGFYSVFLFSACLTASFKTSKNLVNYAVLCYCVNENIVNTSVFWRWLKTHCKLQCFWPPDPQKPWYLQWFLLLTAQKHCK